MWHSSEARRSFAFEALGNKLVTDLAGISEAIGIRLKNDGFDKAFTLLGQFLILKKNAELFEDWMVNTYDASAEEAADCSQCLNDWCEEFL